VHTVENGKQKSWVKLLIGMLQQVRQAETEKKRRFRCRGFRKWHPVPNPNSGGTRGGLKRGNFQGEKRRGAAGIWGKKKKLSIGWKGIELLISRINLDTGGVLELKKERKK